MRRRERRGNGIMGVKAVGQRAANPPHGDGENGHTSPGLRSLFHVYPEQIVV